MRPHGKPRRALIVTGAYAPTMIADMHRARQLAWHLPDYGWDVEILHPDIAFQPASCNDSDSAGFFAPAIKAHGVSPVLPSVFGLLRIGSIGLRALAPTYLAGRRLLAERPFDLVYFSTAQFPLFLLGPAWRRELGIPYVLDLHDPIHAETGAAGAGLKRRLSRRFSHHIERRAVTAAAGLVAVSPRYLDLMETRYATARPQWLKPARIAAIPFGVLSRDLEEARNGHARNVAAGRTKRIIYVGTGGPIMARAFDLLCRGLAQLRAHQPRLLEDVRVELYGTASVLASEADAHLADIAARCGLADIVTEQPARVTYRRSLELLLEADGVLVLGVDDAGYMPSKLPTYAYSGKPLLACVHRDGPAFGFLRDRAAPRHILWFSDEQETPPADAAAKLGSFLEAMTDLRTSIPSADFASYSAADMAVRHAELFEACLAERS